MRSGLFAINRISDDAGRSAAKVDGQREGEGDNFGCEVIILWVGGRTAVETF